MKHPKIFCNLLIILIFLFLLSACLVKKNEKLIYFKNVENNTETAVISTPSESVIKSSDLLQINVFCSDEEINRKFISINNTPSTGGNTSLAISNGYLVDDSGKIVLPLIGLVKATGLNKAQLGDTISKLLLSRKFALDPIVSVRILNFKITFLGEVSKPGVILIPNERISITDAIALAGDLTINGRRDNILLIREVNGKKVSRRFSLNNDELFNSENFYLQNQDIIYVESVRYKAVPHDRFSVNLSTIISSVSLLLLIYTTYYTIVK